MPGGLVADVLGAVTGIGSKAVIDGTSLSGAMSQDRFAFSSAHQGARRSQGLRRKRNERRHQFASKALKRDRGGAKAAAPEGAAAGPAEVAQQSE